tara:strand:- start:85 stop:1170 length:1086 start_codon:yes stop_codon:yes gene_type:complete
MNTQAQLTPVGVDLECDESTIKINVHPEQNAPVSVACTVTNTGSFAQSIDLDSNLDGNDFSLSLSESSIDLDAGEDVTFTATFSASPRIAVLSEDYNITATVTSVTIGSDPFTVPLGQAGSASETGGSVSSLPYSRMDLEVSNPSTRNIEAGEEATLQFTIFNDGNRVDNLEVEIINLQEIEDAGFTFTSDPFFRATVNPGSSSDQGTIILEAPSDSSEEISVQVKMRAFSKLDTQAEASEVSVRVVVAASSGGGGSIGLDSMDQDSIALIAMGGGGLVGVILLLVIISRLTKKAGKQKIAAKEAKKAAKSAKKANKAAKRMMKKAGIPEEQIDEQFEDDFEDDLDFGDLDDMDDFDFEDL